MKVSRRSARRGTSPRFLPACKQNNNVSKSNTSQRQELKECSRSISHDLFNSCFRRMRPHFWYSILPSEGGNDDISSCSRQRWDYLLPIIIHIGLLTKNENARNGFDVQMTKSQFLLIIQYYKLLRVFVYR